MWIGLSANALIVTCSSTAAGETLVKVAAVEMAELMVERSVKLSALAMEPRALAQQVAVAHAIRVVHRDIKPENFSFPPAGQADHC